MNPRPVIVVILSNDRQSGRKTSDKADKLGREADEGFTLTTDIGLLPAWRARGRQGRWRGPRPRWGTPRRCG